MKTIIMLVLVILFLNPSSIFSQIPNEGFELWSTDLSGNLNPNLWNTSNGSWLHENDVFRSEEVHSGIYALKGSTAWYRTFLVGASINTSFLMNNRPSVFSAYYQFHPIGNDTLLVEIQLFHQKVLIAKASKKIYESTQSYSMLKIPLEYLSEETSDSCYILFWLKANPPNSDGAYFLLDDLSFSEATDVSSDRQFFNDYVLFQNYPNPFNPSTTISYHIPKSEYVTLKMYSLLGGEVATLVSGEHSEGEHKVKFEADNLSSGIYLYKLTAGSFTITKKLTLIK